jgi:hypothetical protein
VGVFFGILVMCMITVYFAIKAAFLSYHGISPPLAAFFEAHFPVTIGLPVAAVHAWGGAAKDAGVDKHFNDLRGTACTNFYLKVPGLSDEEAADIMAWEPARCGAIRKRYVDAARIAKGIVARLEKGKGGKR